MYFCFHSIFDHYDHGNESDEGIGSEEGRVVAKRVVVSRKVDDVCMDQCQADCVKFREEHHVVDGLLDGVVRP